MNGFKAAFLNEIEKMYRKKKVIVVLIISLLVIVLGQLVVIGIRNSFGVNMASRNAFPIMVLSVLANTILPLFTALIAIDLFTGEFSHNTMKIALVRPITRLKLFTAKLTAVAFFVLANLLTVMILSTLVGFVFNPSSITIAGLFQTLLSYLITLIPIMTLAIVIVFLANILRSGSAVFFLSIVMFIGLKVLDVAFSRFSSLFITSGLTWYDFWIADSIPYLKVLRLFLIMLGYGIMFFTAAYYLFDKKDL